MQQHTKIGRAPSGAVIDELIAGKQIAGQNVTPLMEAFMDAYALAGKQELYDE